MAGAAVEESDLLRILIEAGIGSVFTVPCTVTAGWHALALEAAGRGRLAVQPTTHEGNLAGLAIGHWFARGEPALIHLQNSGLANAADGLISCAGAEVYDLPLLALITWRGHDDSESSEPHRAIGRRTQALVEAVFGAEALIAGDRLGQADPAAGLAAAIAAARGGGRGVLCLSPAALRATALRAAAATPPPVAEPPAAEPAAWREEEAWPEEPGPAEAPLEREEAILRILAAHPGAAVLFSNGYTARAAQALADQPAHFHNVGYMGGTLAIGWSLARSRPDLEVVVVDGDQNAQMSAMKDHLLLQRPANLHWYVLDNGVGASVGGTPSLPLAPLYRRLARVIRTRPDPPGPCRHPRVRVPADLGGAGAANLAPLARRFRHWIAARNG